MSFSQYLQKKLLDHIFLTSAYTQPSNICVALYSSDPGEDNSGTELTGDNYARVIHNTWTVATLATPSAISNDGNIEFPQPGTGGWGTATHFALLDATTGGNMLAYGALILHKEINEADYVMFKSGDLVITLD
jgi:CubicO group peptidase (beta-lactamase class C family)